MNLILIRNICSRANFHYIFIFKQFIKLTHCFPDFRIFLSSGELAFLIQVCSSECDFKATKPLEGLVSFPTFIKEMIILIIKKLKDCSEKTPNEELTAALVPSLTLQEAHEEAGYGHGDDGL